MKPRHKTISVIPLSPCQGKRLSAEETAAALDRLLESIAKNMVDLLLKKALEKRGKK